MVLQLEIDFLEPVELTPTYEEIQWTIFNYGVFDVPCSEVKPKKRKKI